MVIRNQAGGQRSDSIPSHNGVNMLARADVEYLIEVLESGIEGHDNLITRKLIGKLVQFKDSTPKLSETIDVPYCDGSRITYRAAKRERLKP